MKTEEVKPMTPDEQKRDARSWLDDPKPDYFHTCRTCGQTFIGNKARRICRECDAVQAREATPPQSSFYVASKTIHAPMWRNARERHRIISTWIDEAGEGETADYSELSERCIEEIRKSSAVILYCEPGELLKGAIIEAGAALALGIPVRSVGSCDSLSRVFLKHPLWSEHASLHDAFNFKGDAKCDAREVDFAIAKSVWIARLETLAARRARKDGGK